MVYFFVTAQSAYLCWRAIGKGNAGGAESSLEDGEGGGDATSQNNNVDGTTAVAPIAPGPPVPLALRRLQLVVWNVACVVSLVVVALFWFADVSTFSEMKTVSA